MPPEFPRKAERPEPDISAWFAQEEALIERAARLARDERLGRALHHAVTRMSLRTRRGMERTGGPR